MRNKQYSIGLTEELVDAIKHQASRVSSVQGFEVKWQSLVRQSLKDLYLNKETKQRIKAKQERYKELEKDLEPEPTIYNQQNPATCKICNKTYQEVGILNIKFSPKLGDDISVCSADSCLSEAHKRGFTE